MNNPSRIKSDKSSSQYTSPELRRARRLMEMHRRIKSLQYKRIHLRNELEAIEKYLTALNSQLGSYENYEQLTFNK